MTRKFWLLICGLIVYFQSDAGSARSLAMGNVSTSFRNETSIYHNPAGLAWNSKSFTSFSILNQLFLKELSQKSFAVGKTINNKGIGFWIEQFGDQRLRKTDLGIIYSQLFGELFSFGISLNYKSLSFSDIYGNKNLFYGSFGFVSKVNSKNYFSFLILNPSREFLDPSMKERLKSSISIGYEHLFSKLLTLQCEVNKSLEEKENIKVGFEYQSSSYSFLRMGYEMGYKRVSCGLGFWLKKAVAIDIAFSYQIGFGFNSGMTLTYQIKDPK